MTQRVRNRTVPAGTLTEHAAAAAATASEAPFDLWHHVLQQEIFQRAGGSRVDVLVAAETGETMGKSDDNRRHRAFADQPIEPLRQVLAKAHPVRVRQTAARETDEIDQQRQSSPVMPGRDVDIDGALGRIAQQVILEDLALDRYPADCPSGPA